MAAVGFISSLLTYLGVVVLAHAGYSANHFKRLLLAGGGSLVESPPQDVVLEVCVAFLLLLLGQMLPIKLAPVRYSKKTNLRKYDESYARPDFVSVNHRGRFLWERAQSLK
jgi:hypothetical protein